MKKLIAIVFALGVILPLSAQDSLELGFSDFLNLVKKYHPVVKQAELQIDIGKATVRQARGNFDPTVEAGVDKKEFEESVYWDRFGAAVKVPTWYGLELQGKLQQNEGSFINPDETVPEDGLYSLGVRWEVGLLNQRMATLKQAKLFREQTRAERDLAVNDILYEASLVYFNWVLAYRNSLIYERFVDNARFRLEGIKQQVESGDIAPIDSVEARIALNNRLLDQEQARLSLFKSRLALSNYLWGQDLTPLELKEDTQPGNLEGEEVDTALQINGLLPGEFDVEEHPLINSLLLDIEQLRVEKRLKVNQLLPRITLEYNFLTTSPEIFDSFQDNNYKGSVGLKLPLFLRKERGALQLAKYKLQNARWDADVVSVELKNKVNALYGQLRSLGDQQLVIRDVVADYQTLFEGEERKYRVGESSLFLVNSRERQYINAELERNELRFRLQETKAELFRILGINPKNPS